MLSTSTVSESGSALKLPVLDLNDLALEPNDQPEPASAGTAIGTAIFKLFEHAIAERLKYPKIRLLASDNQVVVLRRAGAKSRYPGEIQIIDDGKYPASRYFGRIDLDGLLHESSKMTEAVRDLLAHLAADPAKVAFKYGKLTGRCCFCNTALSDPRSASHGHGPVCARHYGLDWNANRKLSGFHNAEDTTNEAGQTTHSTLI